MDKNFKLLFSQDVSDLSFTADGLSSGVEYLIFVFAANKNGIGMPVNKTAFTGLLFFKNKNFPDTLVRKTLSFAERD